MPRVPQIRWTKSQEEKLKKSVRRFNNKISREIKKNPQSADYLPQKLNYKELRKEIKTAKDLNRQVQSVNRIFRKNALQNVETEKGIKTTKYEINEIKIQVRRINRDRKKELERAKPSKYRGTLSTVEQNALKPKPFNLDKIKKSDWNAYKRSAREMSKASYIDWRNKRYKEIYLETLDILGEYGEPVKEYIENMDEEYLHDAQYDDPVLNINFISDPLEAKFIAEQILTHWERYQGNI